MNFIPGEKVICIDNSNPRRTASNVALTVGNEYIITSIPHTRSNRVFVLNDHGVKAMYTTNKFRRCNNTPLKKDQTYFVLTEDQIREFMDQQTTVEEATDSASNWTKETNKSSYVMHIMKKIALTEVSIQVF